MTELPGDPPATASWPGRGPLRRLGLDPERPNDPHLEDLVDLVRRVTGAAAVAVTVADGTRVWPLAVATAPGVGDLAAPGGIGDVTASAARGVDGVIWVADAANDDRSRDHAWVRDGGPVRTLAVTSFRAPDRRPVGAVTVGWARPRPRSADDLDLLRRATVQIERSLDLRAEAVEYRRFVDRSPAAVAILDLHGAIERCNPAFAELIGADDPADLIGRHLLDLVDELDHDRARDELARVLLGRDGRVTTELDLRRTGGARFPAAVSVGQLGGPRRSLQLVVRDLSDRIRGELERARLSEQLARAHRLETVGQLAGGLAHDLNNLVTVLVTSLSLADESLADIVGGDDVPRAIEALREDLDRVRSASDRVDELTRKLLQFAARNDGSAARVRVADVVSGLRELLERAVGEDVELRSEVAVDVPDVVVDPAQYEQAITNLVLNARDAMPDGGRITLAARREPTPTGADAVVEVADVGTGMTDEVLARAFEPLFSTKSPDRGTGLGLASVLAFAESVDGTVHIDTAMGAGTRVSLRVPAAPDGSGTVEPADDAPLALVVDPAELTRQVVAAMLIAAGYRTQVVGTAADARTVLAEGEVTALLCELALPDGAGTDVVAGAAKADRPPAVVLLATTPEVRDHTAGRPVLVKPFSSDRLLDAVTAARIAAGQLPDRRA